LGARIADLLGGREVKLEQHKPGSFVSGTLRSAVRSIIGVKDMDAAERVASVAKPLSSLSAPTAFEARSLSLEVQLGAALHSAVHPGA
jgi:hypothetical protein